MAPEVGGGIGRFVTVRHEEEPAVYVGDGFYAVHDTVRFEAGLSMAVRLGGPLALEMNVSVESAPDAHEEPFMPAEDPDAFLPAEWVALPGEPDRFFRAGLGLRWTP